MKKTIAGLLAAALPALSFGADLYLDYNGSTPGFGVNNSGGALTVDPTAVTWNTDSTGGGGGIISAVSSGDVLHFGLEGTGGILFNWQNYGSVSVGGIRTYQTSGSTASINRMQKPGGGQLQLNLSSGAVINTEKANSFYWDFATSGDFTKTGSQWLILADGGNKINGTATLSQGNLIVRGLGTLGTSSNVRMEGGQLRFDDNIDDAAGEQYINMGTLGGSGTIIRDGNANGLNSLTINNMGADMGNGNATDSINFGWGIAAAFVSGASTSMDISKNGAQIEQDQFTVDWESRALTLGGDLTVSLTAGSDALMVGDTFDLFSNTLLGSFDSISMPQLHSGLSWDTSDLAAGGTGTITVIPEPATIGLIGAFGSGLLFIRRRFMI
ncbi:PEP-CTERM sorting domain-containing protein [Pontiella desulfatans]|nr:PEP-CTERM sorting domain-containing protein [Pontiella desulfatans]